MTGYHNYAFEEPNRFSRVKGYLPEFNSNGAKISDEMRREMWRRNETFMGYIPFRILSNNCHECKLPMVQR